MSISMAGVGRIGTFKGHKGAVWSVAVDDNATVAATGSADFTAKVWDATSGQELHHFDHPHIVKSVHLTPVSSVFDGEEPNAFLLRLRDMNVIQDASKLLTGCNDGKIRVFDLSKPREEPLIFNPGDKPTLVRWLRNSKHSSDGKSLLSASVTGDICQWDLSTSTEKPVKTFKVGEEIHDVEICSQFGLMGVASGTTVQFISLNTFELVKKCTLSHQIESVSLHPKQKDTFVVGGDDLWIHVFDYETCEEIATLKGHHGPVHTVRYAPDGGVYASGSEDGTIRMWPHTRQFCS